MPEEGVAPQLAHGARILVVDDEPSIAEALQLVLEGDGHQVGTATSASECLEAITRRPFDLVLLDLMLPDRNGLEVLKDIGRVDRTIPVVMLTAYGSINSAVEATKLGAANFLTKPWNNSKLLLEVRQTLEHRRLATENALLRDQLRTQGPLASLIGKSEAMLQVFVMIRQVARTNSTVLISGESGTGKELVAKAIHKASSRAGKPFVTVNSARIPGEMLDSSLFGHVEGAFSGAIRDRRGCFEVADEGTIFLDELGNLTPETQAKLLGVIQHREFVPLGTSDPVQVDVRILAATNIDLGHAVGEGRFRQDLYYRLNVIGIRMPPLRERMEDVPLLVEEFLTQICRRESNHFLDRNRKSTLRFTPEAHRILMAHSWPGNVRELCNAVEHAVVLASREELGPEVLPPTVTAARSSPAPSPPARPGASLSEIVEEFERGVLLAELEKHGYNQTETAKALRVALSTLNQKIQRLNIEVKRRRSV